MKSSMKQLGRRRRLLLAAGWLLFLVSPPLPGLYFHGNAWFKPSTGPVWGVHIISLAFFDVLGQTKGFWKSMEAINWVWITVATVMFLISPLIFRFASRYRIWRFVRWSAVVLLAPSTLPPVTYMAHGVWDFLYGYYFLASAYTLTFAALVISPERAHNEKRGFEPVVPELARENCQGRLFISRDAGPETTLHR